MDEVTITWEEREVQAVEERTLSHKRKLGPTSIIYGTREVQGVRDEIESLGFFVRFAPKELR